MIFQNLCTLSRDLDTLVSEKKYHNSRLLFDTFVETKSYFLNDALYSTVLYLPACSHEGSFLVVASAARSSPPHCFAQ